MYVQDLGFGATEYGSLFQSGYCVPAADEWNLVHILRESLTWAMPGRGSRDFCNGLKETTGGEFRVYGASMRLLQGT